MRRLIDMQCTSEQGGQIAAYGTSEGVKKEWDERGRKTADESKKDWSPPGFQERAKDKRAGPFKTKKEAIVERDKRRTAGETGAKIYRRSGAYTQPGKGTVTFTEFYVDNKE